MQVAKVRVKKNHEVFGHIKPNFKKGILPGAVRKYPSKVIESAGDIPIGLGQPAVTVVGSGTSIGGKAIGGQALGGQLIGGQLIGGKALGGGTGKLNKWHTFLHAECQKSGRKYAEVMCSPDVRKRYHEQKNGKPKVEIVEEVPVKKAKKKRVSPNL